VLLGVANPSVFLRFYKDEIWDEMKNHKISARFEQSKADRFVNNDEPGFFTTSERSYIVSYILQETPFTEEAKPGQQKGEVGTLSALLHVK